MNNKRIYKYVYEFSGMAFTRKPIKIGKTKQIGMFHFEDEYVVELPKLVSPKIIESDYNFEKGLLEDFLYDKYGKDLKFEYFAKLNIKYYDGFTRYVEDVYEKEFSDFI